MDLSVQARPARAAQLPVLRALELSRLLLHEEPDPARVERLTIALTRDGVLRNPPVVTALAHGARPEDAAVVLDGANRVSALREVGARHVIAQVVHYPDPGIALMTWRHYVAGDAAAALRGRLAKRPGIRITPLRSVGEIEERLGRRDGVAAIADERGPALVGAGVDLLANTSLLRDLVGEYRRARRVYRIDHGDAEALNAEYGAGTLVIFPQFTKAEILSVAARGGQLPAGITRHVIPGRALRLNVPLAWLRSRETAATKQRYLDAAVEQRWREHGVRYYAEPTYLFDE